MVFGFNLEKGNNDTKIRRYIPWCGGVIKKVCKRILGNKWNISGYSTKYFKAGEAVKVEWDAILEVEPNVEKETTIETLN